jgi:O-antigen ligase
MNILALILVVLGYFLIQAIQYRNRKIFAYLGGVILFIIILFQVIPKQYNRFNQPLTFEYNLSKPDSEDFTGITIRLAIWQHAIPLIKQQPFFGYGIGDTPKKQLEEYHKTGFVKGISQRYNCHNQYLESILAAGIFASLILILILILYVIQGLKAQNPYLIMIVIYFFLSMLTESLLERHWGVTTFTVLLPILYKETLLKKEG